MIGVVCDLWLGITIALLLTAAWRDIALRLIPNSVCLALAITGMTGRLIAGPMELAVSLAIAAVLLLIYVNLCVRSFIQARRSRQA